MYSVKVISFDLGGTLVTPDFTHAVWDEGIPSLYAQRNGMSFEQAQAAVEKAYREVGRQRNEWYDVKYWVERFQLGDYRQLLQNYSHRVSQYPEVPQVLSSLAKGYTLIVATGNTTEFLEHMLVGIEHHFAKVFSSISDYACVKSPAFYLAVCRVMGINPYGMVHVGDSWEFDFLAAREAGIEAFHLNRQQKSQDGRSLTSLQEFGARLRGG